MKKHRDTVNRRNRILELLSRKGEVFVHELSKEFGVSEVTIRNDLRQLEEKSLLIRARGGALFPRDTVGMDYRISEKIRLNYKEKVRIGKKAATFIRESETIFLDGGTTTFQIARHLQNTGPVTIVTNALNIITHLIHQPDIHLIVPGGYLREKSLSLIGPMAERNLKEIFVDKAFLAADGFDISRGVFTPNMEEAALSRIIIDNAKEVIVVADSGKFKRKSIFLFCPAEKINRVITDEKITKKQIAQFREQGTGVIIA